MSQLSNLISGLQLRQAEERLLSETIIRNQKCISDKIDATESRLAEEANRRGMEKTSSINQMNDYDNPFVNF